MVVGHFLFSCLNTGRPVAETGGNGRNFTGFWRGRRLLFQAADATIYIQQNRGGTMINPRYRPKICFNDFTENEYQTQTAKRPPFRGDLSDF